MAWWASACLENILTHKKKFEITIFGDETYVNYNRILLSSVLAGEKDPSTRSPSTTSIGIRKMASAPPRRPHHEREYDSPQTRLPVMTAASRSTTSSSSPPAPARSSRPWTASTAATSSPSATWTIPTACCASPGLASAPSSSAEASSVSKPPAACNSRAATSPSFTSLDTLMNNQLDTTAGEFLKRRMEELGIEVLTGRRTTAILGRDEVEAVEFADGDRIRRRSRRHRRRHPPQRRPCPQRRHRL